MGWGSIALAFVGLIALSCGGGSGNQPSDKTVAPATEPATREATASPFSNARAAEADDDPSLPGEYIDLPQIYGGHYANQDGPNTNAHVLGAVDYSAQGLPPAGGPHWGSGACGDDPATAPASCGPVPWGIYRTPWPAESLVHNMEHAGVIIWYNTSAQPIINDLERFAEQQLRGGKMVVLVPYPDMAPEQIAITVWSRRDILAADQYNPDRLQRFIDTLYCRFDPEGFC